MGNLHIADHYRFRNSSFNQKELHHIGRFITHQDFGQLLVLRRDSLRETEHDEMLANQWSLVIGDDSRPLLVLQVSRLPCATRVLSRVQPRAHLDNPSDKGGLPGAADQPHTEHRDNLHNCSSVRQTVLIN